MSFWRVRIISIAPHSVPALWHVKPGAWQQQGDSSKHSAKVHTLLLNTSGLVSLVTLVLINFPDRLKTKDGFKSNMKCSLPTRCIRAAPGPCPQKADTENKGTMSTWYFTKV